MELCIGSAAAAAHCPTVAVRATPGPCCMQADITCDSDGVLNHFISTRDAVDFDPILPLHELRATEPYPLAMFLTGRAAGCWHQLEH